MTTPPPAGSLYVVSTPIGNLSDLSHRAIEVLNSVATVLAEDTRHSRTLLARYDIRTRMESYHEHNEARVAEKVMARILAGESVALVSDAGTPLLSDPGARLITAAIEAGITIVPVPGASALLAALVGAGMSADRFTYFGFLERKGKARSDAIAEIVASRHTSVVYEAPGRVGALLADLAEAGAGDRAAVVARELTKQFEEFSRATASELAAKYAEAAPRGEVVVLVAGAADVVVDEAAVRTRAAELKAEGLSAREVARVLSIECGASRNLAYRIAHE
ncbi:MAG: 16S rRNA (cytidine(1402)-2'-O)-methyltransferase [Gemmatimonadetes bacterium]|nr:16S rRNA (cytidine(1402)-2'-O)-methyltransferase [Gemmatimonadota bacterium]